MTNEEIVEQIQNGIDTAANQEKLLRQNERYVRKVVREFCGFDTANPDFEDYIQEGCIALLDAAMRYDKEAGANFLTFAEYRIHGAISRYWENCSSSVRVPSYMRLRIRKYQRYRQQYRHEHGKEPGREELLAYMEIPEKAFDLLEKTIHDMRSVSIDQDTKGGDGDPLSELLQSDEDIEELITYSVYNRELKRALDSALSILDWQTRAAIQSVFYQRYSMEGAAEIFGCSKQAVNDRIHRGFYRIIHSEHRRELESFMWEGYRFNIYAYSECSDEVYGETEAGREDMAKGRLETEDNGFLV